MMEVVIMLFLLVIMAKIKKMTEIKKNEYNIMPIY